MKQATIHLEYGNKVMVMYDTAGQLLDKVLNIIKDGQTITKVDVQ